MTVCVHLCRGNYGGAWVAEGGYEPVAKSAVQRHEFRWLFLEYDSDRAGGFEPLRHLPKGKTVVLGLVTTKNGKLETKDVIKQRIEEAATIVPLDQLCLSPQCGFASGIEGMAMTVRRRTCQASSRDRSRAKSGATHNEQKVRRLTWQNSLQVSAHRTASCSYARSKTGKRASVHSTPRGHFYDRKGNMVTYEQLLALGAAQCQGLVSDEAITTRSTMFRPPSSAWCRR